MHRKQKGGKKITREEYDRDREVRSEKEGATYAYCYCYSISEKNAIYITLYDSLRFPLCSIFAFLLLSFPPPLTSLPHLISPLITSFHLSSILLTSPLSATYLITSHHLKLPPSSHLATSRHYTTPLHTTPIHTPILQTSHLFASLFSSLRQLHHPLCFWIRRSKFRKVRVIVHRTAVRVNRRLPVLLMHRC